MRFRDVKKGMKNPQKEIKPSVAYATLLSRAKAFITDIFMIGLPVTLIIMVVFGYQETKSAGAMDVIVQHEESLEQPPNPVASATQMFLIFGAHVYLWRRSGQTPGAKFAQIKVVDSKTKELASYPKLIVRFFGYFISLLTFGYLTSLFRKDKRTLHDLLSGTAVVYTDS